MFLNSKIEDIKISWIGDVRNLVTEFYPDRKEYSFSFSKRPTTVLGWVMFLHEIYKQEKPLRIELTEYPPSKHVRLLHKGNGHEVFIIIKSSTNRELFNLLEKFKDGKVETYWSHKLERYRNLYMVYEALKGKKKYKFVAVRHAISHPYIANPRVRDAIKNLFGSEDINISRSSHRRIMRSIHEELYLEVEKILIKRIISVARTSEEKFGGYVIC